jgi:hypothetical protein
MMGASGLTDGTRLSTCPKVHIAAVHGAPTIAHVDARLSGRQGRKAVVEKHYKEGMCCSSQYIMVLEDVKL